MKLFCKVATYLLILTPGYCLILREKAKNKALVHFIEKKTFEVTSQEIPVNFYEYGEPTVSLLRSFML
ncbi:hypothetical protein EGR_03514 [Echinococcus granulosus]|uniref:Uncharacterized protein n=1 Tax=Echinococcus granulosus TaxID=6210 RepID=W6UJK2_ECHGR|nr:hypothetical protein EGR_03514 [Echinococcus granulosus]EUB61700.1 hypothetical protein EGR_03514 [Echinococcus granulosus]